MNLGKVFPNARTARICRLGETGWPLAIIVLLVIVPVPGKAADASNFLLFSKGPLLLRPRLGVTEQYNDNIFYQPKGVGDFISTISPGLNLQLGGHSKNMITLDYSFNQHFYADRTDLNSGEHSFGLQSRIRAERLALSGSDSVQLLSSPIGVVTEYVTRVEPVQQAPPAEGGGTQTIPGGETPGSIRNSEVIAAIAERDVKWQSYSDSYNLGYAVSEKTGVYVQGQHLTTAYEKGISLYDYNTLRATAGFGYRAFPKVGLFGELFYGQTATTPNFPAPKNPHLEFLGGFVGARGNFTPKLSGTVKVGYQEGEFSDKTPAPSSPVVDTTLSYRPSDKSTVSLSFARLHDVSIQYGGETSYSANVASLQLDQIIGSSRRWRASVGGRFGTFDYQSPGGASIAGYDQYSTYFRLAYQLEMWLSASVGYSWDGLRSGSAGGVDYNINRVTVGLTVGY